MTDAPGWMTDALAECPTEGAEVDIRTPAELKKMIPLDMAKWARVAKEAGMSRE